MIGFGVTLHVVSVIVLIIAPFTTGQQLFVLQDPTRSAYDWFGYSVSISNNFALVGSSDASRGTLSNCGIASILQYDTKSSNWNMLSSLSAYDQADSDNFGYSVSLNAYSAGLSIHALIGAPKHGFPSFGKAGTAYLYKSHTTNLTQYVNITQFSSPNLQPNANFGYSVALSPSYIVISALYYNNVFPFDGTVYIFKDLTGNDNWALLKQLNASDPNQYGNFGSSVAIDGDLILIGAQCGNFNGTLMNTGTAYLFSRNNGGPDMWNMVIRLTSSNPVTNSQFGYSVSISESNIAIGEPYPIGNVYLFNQNNGGTNSWGLSSIVSPPNGHLSDQFGSSVAIKNFNLAIGAFGFNTYQGIAYIANLDPIIPTNPVISSLFIINDTTPATNYDYFGCSVAIDNNLALFGSYGKNNYMGEAYSLELAVIPSNPLNPSNQSYSKLFIIIAVIIGIISVGITIGIVIKIKSNEKPYEFNETSGSNSRRNNKMNNDKDRDETRSNASQVTIDSNVSGNSEVRQIPLTENMSIRTRDLDLYNPKVVRNNF